MTISWNISEIVEVVREDQLYKHGGVGGDSGWVYNSVNNNFERSIVSTSSSTISGFCVDVPMPLPPEGDC